MRTAGGDVHPPGWLFPVPYCLLPIAYCLFPPRIPPASNPPHRNTGNRGYRANRPSTSDNRQR
jgi:hypothetical protein